MDGCENNQLQVAVLAHCRAAQAPLLTCARQCTPISSSTVEPAAQLAAPVQAAEENDLPCLEMLLERGADVAATDDASNNVLHAVAGQKERVGAGGGGWSM